MCGWYFLDFMQSQRFIFNWVTNFGTFVPQMQKRNCGKDLRSFRLFVFILCLFPRQFRLSFETYKWESLCLYFWVRAWKNQTRRDITWLNKKCCKHLSYPLLFSCKRKALSHSLSEWNSQVISSLFITKKLFIQLKLLARAQPSNNRTFVLDKIKCK